MLVTSLEILLQNKEIAEVYVIFIVFWISDKMQDRCYAERGIG